MKSPSIMARTLPDDLRPRLAAAALTLSLAAAALAAPGPPPDAAPPGADAAAAGPRTEAVDLAAYQQVRYVSVSAGSDTRGDGSKARPWASPARALARIADAARGRRYAVLVAAGAYPTRALRLKSHVDLYGGFAPGGWERDIVRHRTTLDAQEKDRVLLGADHARMDGFTLRGGRARGHGGGVLCERVSPAFTNNTFEDNATLVGPDYVRGIYHQVGTEGGAIACVDYASPRIEQNLFLNNRTEMGGGGAIGMRSDSVRPAEEIPGPVVRNNVFIGCRTGLADTDPDVKKRARSSNGGAISLSNYLAEITGNVFLGNHAGGNGDGGGIYCEYESSPRIAHNHFVGNRGEDDGGAIYSMKLSEPRIEANVFAGNTGGGTVRLSKHGRARIARNLLFANPGGGINSGDSWSVIEENVIMDNDAPGVSLGIQTAAHLRPSVLRGNVLRGNGRAQIQLENAEGTVIEGNNVRGGYAGSGNVDADPGRDTRRHPMSPLRLIRHAAAGRTTLAGGDLPLPAEHLPGRILRVGERWGVVHSARPGELTVWGDIPASGQAYELLGSYLPTEPAK
jgi:hypothetical protein